MGQTRKGITLSAERLPPQLATIVPGWGASPPVLERRSCGCGIAGVGTLPDPVRHELCPMHTAAPDLLAACEAALEYPDIRASHPGLCDQIRAAIAKTRG